MSGGGRTGAELMKNVKKSEAEPAENDSWSVQGSSNEWLSRNIVRDEVRVSSRRKADIGSLNLRIFDFTLGEALGIYKMKRNII